jgi:hypothetical protein
MQAGSITRIEKNVDQAASVLFGVACGYSAFLWLGAVGRFGQPVVAALAAALAVVAYLLSFRVLSGIQPEARKLPVREFRLREVEPLDDLDEFEEFESFDAAAYAPLEGRPRPALLVAPEPGAQELLLTDIAQTVDTSETEVDEAEDANGELELGFGEPEPEPAELAQIVEDENPVDEDRILVAEEPAEIGPHSRVVRLFDAAAMPTPGQLGSQIDRHLQRETAPIQSEEAAQALQDALAELRRAIPSRRG